MITAGDLASFIQGGLIGYLAVSGGHTINKVSFWLIVVSNVVLCHLMRMG